MIEQTATFELLSPDGAKEACTASFDVSQNEVAMRTSSQTTGEQFHAGRDAFHALELFRRAIEPLGWRVLCNGARKDAYPSGMSRDMGRGFMVYSIPPEGPPVQTFDPANAEQVGSVEEQLENWNAWVEQLRAAKSQ